MFAVFFTILSLMSVGHSAPLDCEKLIRPLDQLDSEFWVGRWAFVAGSLKDAASVESLRKRDSVTVDFYNSSYTQANRYGDECQYYHHNLSLEGRNLKMMVSDISFTGSFFQVSCPDCLLFTLDLESLNYKSMDLYLLSKRRQLEKTEMEEFVAQVECLNMPPPVVMDPMKDLCPEKTEQKTMAQIL